MVSVFYKSPVEHSSTFRARLAAQHACEKQTKRAGGQEAFPPVPEGFVRVQFFFSMKSIKFARDPDMEAIVRLGRKGELDLSQFKKMWNLENVVPVSPWRWDPVPFENSVISGVSVRMMSDRINAIQFIEQRVSRSTATKRAVRQAILSFFAILYTCLLSLFSHVSSPFNAARLPNASRGGRAGSHAPPSPMCQSTLVLLLLTALLTFTCFQFAEPFTVQALTRTFHA